MCGVIGYNPLPPGEGDRTSAKLAFMRLLFESRARGTHCFGVARPGYVARSADWREIAADFEPNDPHVAHARYSTSGEWRIRDGVDNNQPIVVDHMALALNGVIHMGTKAEYEAEYMIECDVDNDAEIFLRLLKKFGEQSAHHVLEGLKGSFAGCWLVGDELWVGRNERRPLWTARQFGGRWFASTRDIFLRADFTDDIQEVPTGVLRTSMPWSVLT